MLFKIEDRPLVLRDRVIVKLMKQIHIVSETNLNVRRYSEDDFPVEGALPTAVTPYLASLCPWWLVFF